MTQSQNQPAHADLRAALLASTHQNIAAAEVMAEEATRHFKAFEERFDRLGKLVSTIECCLDVLYEARATASERGGDIGAPAVVKLSASEISRIAAVIRDFAHMVEAEGALGRRSRALAFFGALAGGVLAGAVVVLLANLLLFGPAI